MDGAGCGLHCGVGWDGLGHMAATLTGTNKEEERRPLTSSNQVYGVFLQTSSENHCVQSVIGALISHNLSVREEIACLGSMCV